MEQLIFRKFTLAADIASNVAIPTVNSWIRHRKDGGLAYETFRATCVREYVLQLAKPPRPPLLMSHTAESSRVRKGS